MTGEKSNKGSVFWAVAGLARKTAQIAKVLHSKPRRDMHIHAAAMQL